MNGHFFVLRATRLQWAKVQYATRVRLSIDNLNVAAAANEITEVGMECVVRYRLIVIATVFVGLAVPEAAAQTSECSQSPFSVEKTGRTVVVTVDWEKLQRCAATKQPVDGRIAQRIDEDTSLDVKVINFNFVAYSVSYQVEETVVESYVTLEKLWAQLLGLPLFPGATLPPGAPSVAAVGPCESFEVCLANWALLIARTNIELDNARQQHAQSVALTKQQRDEVAKNHEALSKARDNVSLALKQLDNHVPQNVQQVTQFESVYARQQALFEKVAAYGSAAKRVTDGEVHHLGKKNAGTVVVVGITPKDHTQASQTPVADVEYFVHSQFPLTFHVGYAYTSIRAVKFQTVRALSQADLFAMVKSNENTSAMLAMLSLGRNFGSDMLGVHATLGTDFPDPGDRLYVGGSVQLFKRLFITGGMLSATQEVGEEPVVDRIGDALQARDLFTAIRTHRSWKNGFGAISFRVY